jgi:hypothetical protein
MFDKTYEFYSKLKASLVNFRLRPFTLLAACAIFDSSVFKCLAKVRLGSSSFPKYLNSKTVLMTITMHTDFRDSGGVFILMEYPEIRFRIVLESPTDLSFGSLT